MKKIFIILLLLPTILLADEDRFPGQRVAAEGDGPSANLEKASSPSTGARSTSKGLNATDPCPFCIKNNLQLTETRTNVTPGMDLNKDSSSTTNKVKSGK